MFAQHQDTILVVAQYNAGPYLGSSVIRGLVDSLPNPAIAVQYVPINRILSDTEYRTAVQSVERVIVALQPRYIVSMDDDYMKYMSQQVKDTYGKKFVTIYKAETVQDNPTCAIMERIMQRSYMLDSPIYVVRDENSFHAEAARTLVQCLRDRNHEVEFDRVGSLSDLRRILTGLESKPRGFLVSYMGTIYDSEFSQFLDQDRINQMILDSNKRHIDITLVRGNKNLSVVLIPRITGVKISNGSVQIDQVIPQLFVDPVRLQQLGGEILYKNMFDDIAGVIRQ